MVDALAGLGRCLGPGAQRRDEGPEPLLAALAGIDVEPPSIRPGAWWPVTARCLADPGARSRGQLPRRQAAQW